MDIYIYEIKLLTLLDTCAASLRQQNSSDNEGKIYICSQHPLVKGQGGKILFVLCILMVLWNSYTEVVCLEDLDNSILWQYCNFFFYGK